MLSLFIFILYFIIVANCKLLDWYGSRLSNTNEQKRKNVEEFYELKAGPEARQAIWYYTGVVRNPLTGSSVVGIEGVEVVKPLGAYRNRLISTAPSNNSNDTNGSSSPRFKAQYLSKKLFCYVDNTNRTNLINSYRVRHHSPLRKLNPVKVFSEKVTLEVDDCDRTIASIEWPGAHRTMKTGKIDISKALELSWLDTQTGKKKLNVMNFMSASLCPPGGQHMNLWRPGKLSSRLRGWVSFSPSSTDRSGGRSQEYYTISSKIADSAPILPEHVPATVAAIPKNRLTKTNATLTEHGSILRSLFMGVSSSKTGGRVEAVMSYRRHGEGPSWYAIGQPCVVELNGYRYAHMKHLPRHALYLAHNADPAFFDFSIPSGNHSVSLSNFPVSINKNKSKLSGKDHLSLSWFANQKDIADDYKPWYENIGMAVKKRILKWK